MLSYLLSILFLSCVSSKGVNNIGEHDCCPLVWKPLIKTYEQWIVPPDAISLSGFKDLQKYYTIMKGSSWYGIDKIGTLDLWPTRGTLFERDGVVYNYHPGCLSVRFKDRCEVTPNDPILVLTNPHGCKIGFWRKQVDWFSPYDTSSLLFPKISSMIFGRRPWAQDDMYGGYFENEYFHTIDNGITYKDTLSEALYIDCRESAKSIFNAQLFNITYEIDSLLGGKQPVILQSSTVVNNINLPQSFEVDLTAETSKSLQMSQSRSENYSTFHSFTWSASLEASFFKIASFKAGLEEKWEERMNRFASEGSVSMESTHTSYRFNQKVAVPPMSSTTVNIVSIPIQGTVPFQAKYRFTHIKKGVMTIEQTLNTLRRLGFPNMDKIMQEGDHLILTYDGRLSLESGYDTHVDITSTPLEWNSTRPVIHYKVFPFKYN